MRTDLDKIEIKECVFKAKEILENLKGVKKSSVENIEELSISTHSIEDLEEVVDRKATQRNDTIRRVTSAVNFQPMKGYLQKKNKQKILMWDERFFSIKNERLYWYRSHKALEPINSLSLSEFTLEDTGENPLRFNVVTPTKTVKLLANGVEDKTKWLLALQKPENTEIQLNLINEITKESLFEDVNRAVGGKRDLMKVAKRIVMDIPRKKHKKSTRNVESEEKKESMAIERESKKEGNMRREERNESEENSGCCSSCFAFLRRRKQDGGAREPFIIN